MVAEKTQMMICALGGLALVAAFYLVQDMALPIQRPFLLLVYATGLLHGYGAYIFFKLRSDSP